MKPIIIFTQKDENGNICMSAEKFEKYIQMAYESGVEDGRSKGPIPALRGSGLSGIVGVAPCYTDRGAKRPSEKACKAEKSAQEAAYHSASY